MSPTYQPVRQAIIDKRIVIATYDGFVREMCPHAIGTGKDGGEQALFFQFAGGSRRGLPPDGQWRCIPIGGLSSVSIRHGQWHTGPDHTKQQTCVKQIDIEVAH